MENPEDDREDSERKEPQDPLLPDSLAASLFES